MRAVTAGCIAGVIAILQACGHLSSVPADFNARVLNVKEAVTCADAIVLAYPVTRSDLGTFVARGLGSPASLRVVEVQTELRTIRTLKGQQLPIELTYEFYEVRNSVLIGPPQGPSGPMGSPGIFFLRKRGADFFRSFVDVYRTDIATPWVSQGSTPGSDGDTADCVADILLSPRGSDDLRSFGASLEVNTSIARQLVGYVTTYTLLRALEADTTHPAFLRRRACDILADAYPLEMPSSCAPVIGQESCRLAADRAQNQKEQLRAHALEWVQDRIGTRSRGELYRYCHLLMQSTDIDTRTLGQVLLAALERQGW